jgi:hypothetical protein
LQYTIVNGSKAQDVIQEVNERLKRGWKLHGDLVIASMPDSDGDLGISLEMAAQNGRIRSKRKAKRL